MKVDAERFGYNNLLQNFRLMKSVVKIAIDVWWNIRRKDSDYKKKFLTAYSTFLFLKILLHCCHVDWCFKFVEFLMDITEDDEKKNADFNFLEKKLRKRSENEYELMVHDDTCKGINTYRVKIHQNLICCSPWCNCYRRRKWTRRHEFKSWTKLIAFHIALIPLGKVWIQLFSFQLWVNSRID